MAVLPPIDVSNILKSALSARGFWLPKKAENPLSDAIVKIVGSQTSTIEDTLEQFGEDMADAAGATVSEQITDTLTSKEPPISPQPIIPSISSTNNTAAPTPSSPQEETPTNNTEGPQAPNPTLQTPQTGQSPSEDNASPSLEDTAPVEPSSNISVPPTASTNSPPPPAPLPPPINDEPSFPSQQPTDVSPITQGKEDSPPETALSQEPTDNQPQTVDDTAPSDIPANAQNTPNEQPINNSPPDPQAYNSNTDSPSSLPPSLWGDKEWGALADADDGQNNPSTALPPEETPEIPPTAPLSEPEQSTTPSPVDDNRLSKPVTEEAAPLVDTSPPSQKPKALWGQKEWGNFANNNESPQKTQPDKNEQDASRQAALEKEKRKEHQAKTQQSGKTGETIEALQKGVGDIQKKLQELVPTPAWLIGPSLGSVQEFLPLIDTGWIAAICSILLCMATLIWYYSSNETIKFEIRQNLLKRLIASGVLDAIPYVNWLPWTILVHINTFNI